MILLKANSELKVIFQKLMNTMGIDLSWTEVFAVNNSNLLLAGKDSVLLFDFGSKIVSFNPVEVNLKEDTILPITTDELMKNVLNMTLYVFGKWGKIKGLTVEKDYSQLNRLFGNFLQEINVESVLTSENLRFYRSGIQVTYEDVVQAIIDQEKQQEDEKKPADDSEEKQERSRYDIGLWHKIVWTSEHYIIEKEKLSREDRAKARIGNNFYIVNYKCPVCQEKLFMVIYPEGKELLIDTDEKGVYLSRAYSCSTCHRFYTPRPHLLLAEGDVFSIGFEEDREAYEDYLELVGKQGERTSNCNFNEYESEYRNKSQENKEQLEEICSNMASMTENEIIELQDKMDSGFYPQKSIDIYYKSVDNELAARRQHRKQYGSDSIPVNKKSSDTDKNEEYNRLTKDSRKAGYSGKKEDSNNAEAGRDAGDHDYTDGRRDTVGHDNAGGRKNTVAHDCAADSRDSGGHDNAGGRRNTRDHDYTDDRRNTENYDNPGYGLKTEDRANTMQKKNSEYHIASKAAGRANETVFDTNYADDRNSKTERRDPDIKSYGSKEEELLRRVNDCREKNYVNILRVMEDVKEEACSESLKASILKSLKELLEKRGKKELDEICLKIPANLSKTQYLQLKEVIKQYKEIDHSAHMKRLEDMRDVAEKQEIASYIKRADAKDRNSLMELYQKLRKEEYEERNATPYLESIQDRIYRMDDAAIRRICPEPAELSFEDGLRIYEEITSLDLLPDLKTDILNMIKKRLTKIKMNECEQLVGKLSKDLNGILPENSRVHFYDVRKGMRSDNEDEEFRIIVKALNTYASGRGKYEFPILICDASGKENGVRGFVLSPDHIFYNTLLNSGTIDIMKVDSITAQKSMINTGIYADTSNAGRMKLSNSLELPDIQAFADALNIFVAYLKEKPESRDISYIAKEKHSVKCCYRCGYVYRGDNVCPKCGSKLNE